MWGPDRSRGSFRELIAQEVERQWVCGISCLVKVATQSDSVASAYKEH